MHRQHRAAASLLCWSVVWIGCHARAPTTGLRAVYEPTYALADIETVEATLDDQAAQLASLGIEVPQAAPVDMSTGSTTIEDDAAALETVEAESAPPPPPSSSPAEGATPTKSRRQARTSRKRDRCERICELSEHTCELTEHVCELAFDHRDDPRYQDACDRARNQCRAASNACFACTE